MLVTPGVTKIIICGLGRWHPGSMLAELEVREDGTVDFRVLEEGNPLGKARFKRGRPKPKGLQGPKRQ